MKKTLSLLFALALTACSSSPYVYHVQPTQLHSNETKYYINSVAVNLSLGDGAVAGDTSFASQIKLKEQFNVALINHMKEQGIYAVTKDDRKFSVALTINYQRNFNYGGKALNKPQVSHSVIISDNAKQKVASFSLPNYTTNYGGFTNAAVNIEIAAFSWGAEDEPRDIDLIAKKIIEDLADLGD